MAITRRRLLATTGAGIAGGGAAVVLSACGSDADEPSAERDVELLQAALDAEAGVARLYGLAADQGLDREAAEAAGAFGSQASAQVRRLTDAIESAGGEPAKTGGSQAAAAESVVEAIALTLDEAIAAYHDAVGELSTAELRQTVFELMTADAAQLAAVRGLLGEDQVPEAFVTGGDQPLTGVAADEEAE